MFRNLLIGYFFTILASLLFKKMNMFKKKKMLKSKATVCFR